MAEGRQDRKYQGELRQLGVTHEQAREAYQSDMLNHQEKSA
jgi:hypothetical protein